MIHGIAQEKTPQEQLLTSWVNTIHSSSPGLLSSCRIEMAYYATELFKHTQATDNSFITMNGGELKFDEGLLKFEESYIRDYIKNTNSKDGYDSFHVENSSNTQTMDNFLTRNFVRFIAFLEKSYPSKGELALKFIKQAHTYLQKPDAGHAVDTLVMPYLLKKPKIIIAHSLGTVIAFKLLRELDDRLDEGVIPLLITLGSPLSLEAVKNCLGFPRKKPKSVKKWVNFFDPSDIVTLGRGLTKESFADYIENVGDVDINTLKCHEAEGYLSHNRFISLLADSINHLK